jgi:hypothetical protein
VPDIQRAVEVHLRRSGLDPRKLRDARNSKRRATTFYKGCFQDVLREQRSVIAEQAVISGLHRDEGRTHG